MNRTKEIRVLKVFGKLGTGGAEKWLIALLQYCKKNGEVHGIKYSFDVLITSGESSDLDHLAEQAGAKLHYIKYSRTSVFYFVRRYRRLLRQGRYDAIHDHQEHTSGFHFLFGLGLNSRIRITHLHNASMNHRVYQNDILRKFIFKLGRFLVWCQATHVLSTSKTLLSDQGFDRWFYRRKYRRALYCGFDTLDFSGNREVYRSNIRKLFGWGRDVKVLLFVGRLNSSTEKNTNQKNPEFALKVARECIERDQNIRFLMVGGGEPILSELRARVTYWGMDEKIKVLGKRDDVPTLMLASDLFFLPSLHEGLGMVAVEAQAAGLPCLVSDIVPAECVVTSDAVTFHPLSAGLLSWRDQILQCLADQPQQRSEWNARVSQSKFSIENSTRDLLEIYSC